MYAAYERGLPAEDVARLGVEAGIEFDGHSMGPITLRRIERAARQGVSPSLQEGARVTVYVNEINVREGELSLRLLPAPRMRLYEVTPGASYVGYITNIKPYGVFVDIDAEQEGLVHISEMSYDYVSDPERLVSMNQEVTVRVLSVDLAAGKISLTMK